MMSAKLRDFICCAFLIALSFFLYWACRHGAFIWDDQFLVVKNSLIRSPILALEAFRHFLGEEPPSNFYRPVQTLTYLLDYWRAGLEPTAYHDGSILIHALNGSLLFLFVRGLLRRAGGVSEKKAAVSAFLVAALWVAHPIHSATVAYVAGRADSLALFFLLAGWCFWDALQKSKGSYRWVFAGALFFCGFLAVCSKEAALVGIGVFLVAVLFSGETTPPRQKIQVLGGCLALLALYLALRYSIGAGEASQATGQQANRWLLVLRALGDYLRIFFFPGNLRMERQIVMVPNLFRDPASFDPLFPYLIVPGVLFIVFLVISVVKKGSLLHLRRFGVLWFTASVLPVSNVFVLNATVAEHWLYLPSVGLLIVLVGWTLETTPKTQKFLAVLACLAVIGLCLRTKIRVLDWASPVAFFEATIRDGGDTARIRVNLANEYQLHGNPKKGEETLRSVLKLSPSYSQARHALVINLKIQGRTDEFNQIFATETNPFGQSFRGKLYAAQRLTADGKVHEAADILRKMRTESPDSWFLTKEIAGLFEKMGQTEDKLPLYESFAENHWWHAESHIDLGRLYESLGRPEDASRLYLEASRLDIRDTALRAHAEEILRRNSGKASSP